MSDSRSEDDHRPVKKMKSERFRAFRDEEEEMLENFVLGDDTEITKSLKKTKTLKSKQQTHSEKTKQYGDGDDGRISDEEPFDTSFVERKPAWVDEDDETIVIKNEATDKVEKLSKNLSAKFKAISGLPSWADLSEKKNDGDLISGHAGDFILKSKSLTKTVLEYKRCTDLNEECHNEGNQLRCIEFHPNAKVALVGGGRSVISLVQVDGVKNLKIQSVKVENFFIRCAHFTVDGEQMIMGSSRFYYFYYFDLMAGKVIKVPQNKNILKGNVGNFIMCPDGTSIAIAGDDGYIHIVCSRTKEWIHSFKMNVNVHAIAFSPNGKLLYSCGDEGEVYVWDMQSRQCLHKFYDDGCIVGTSICVSPNNQYLACGSSSGVVNIYDVSTVAKSNSPKPLKEIMNLTTSISTVKFNHSSELLAMASEEKATAFKLLHLPSLTVFKNFPPNVRHDSDQFNYLGFDFSLNSGYMALGCYKFAQLYRLQHYHNY